jgi:superfamily I DNA/RNA helicase/mRNA-degrading endonuclease RelE of RelBE toxin-antitoxin system
MEFRIADTFTESLARLTGDEQKAVKTTAFDLQIDPKNPGMKFHRLAKAKDKNFWSVRVSSDLRLIVHRSDASLLLCFVGHHDKAYDWAERRKLEVHPTTGAAQLVEIRETVKEIVVPVYVPAEEPGVRAKPAAPLRGEPIFASVTDEDLLAYGVPAEWVADVRVVTEDSILALVDHLPAEAAEALLELATGGRPQRTQPLVAPASPFDHPDAQRRFRVMANVEELQRALDYPWEKWTVFLHPEQQSLVERDFNGPAKVGGSAGTGKTVVALHRAVELARRNPDARVLLTTFSDTLASALQTKLKRLLGGEPRLAERIDVHSLGSLGLRLHKAHVGPVTVASRELIELLLREAAASESGLKFGHHFLLAEWEQVVDARQLDSWEAYRDVARLGRKTRLPESQRKVLWSVFERVRSELATRKVLTQAEVFTAVARALAESARVVFDFAVVDECQDIGVPHLRFFAALGADRPNALFFAGDLGQRIFQQPFSWKALGVDIRGRSRTLRVNYRTSHQIRQKADRLLGPVETDADGNAEDRRHVVSVFNGPTPEVRAFPDESTEVEAVARWLGSCRDEGILPHEIGIFVRSADQIGRARAAVEAAGLEGRLLDEHLDTASGQASICTMHPAKGLEFRAVAVMACDDEVIPLQERIETVGDDSDLREVYETERHLLYVACTRARDRLLVTAVEPPSEFLDDLEVSARR